MTKKEAIKLMEQGVKMTHYYFTPDEWVYIDNGQYVLEDGVECIGLEFWEWRKCSDWENGWERWQK